MFRGSMNARLTVLAAQGIRLGIRGNVRVAAALLVTGIGIFVNATPRLHGASRPLPSQVALGEPGGDIHTAVRWFLTWQSRGEVLAEG